MNSPLSAAFYEVWNRTASSMGLVLVVTAFISVNGYFASVGKQFSSDSGIVKNTWKMSALYLPVPFP